MKKVILFPFHIDDDNRETYAKTIQLAEAKNTGILLFTSLPKDSGADRIDEIYFHLLTLNGHYQSCKNEWEKTLAIPIERIIQFGDIANNLKKLVADKKPQWIISQKHSPYLNMEAMKKNFAGNWTVLSSLL